MCLFVCQSTLPPECLTSASSVTTLQPLGPLLWLTHWGVERSRQFLLQPPTQTPGLSDCIFLCLSYITLSVRPSVCHKNRRGVWLTLWVVTEQLWGVSPPAAKCRGRAAQLLRLAGRSTDWSGRGAATTIPAQLIPALTCPPTSSSTQQVTPHLMPELAPCNFFRSNPFMQLGRCCWHCACASKIHHLHFFQQNHGRPSEEGNKLLFFSKVYGLL